MSQDNHKLSNGVYVLYPETVINGFYLNYVAMRYSSKDQNHYCLTPYIEYSCMPNLVYRRGLHL